MRFTIITPSFNQLGYLRRSAMSVADQVTEGGAVDGCPLSVDKGVSLAAQQRGKLTTQQAIRVHHHVQDGGSTDGSVEFLKEYQQAVSCELSAVSQGVTETPKAECRTPNTYLFSFQSERDDGMYDALNRGVDSCLGLEVDGLNRDEQTPGTPNSKLQTSNRDDSLVAWLNCDEQYLPGTLKKVSDFFLANPSVDILFGGMLMVDEEGELLSCRKAMPMRRLFLEASYLYNYSCAMFFRRSAWEQLGGFDTSFKNAGDEELIRRAMKIGLKTAVLKDYLSVFTYSQTNLSSGGSALEEHERLKHQNPKWVNLFRVPINLLRLGEKFLRGGFVQKTLVEYEIYVGDSPRRTKFWSENSNCRWPDEARPYLMSHRLK